MAVSIALHVRCHSVSKCSKDLRDSGVGQPADLLRLEERRALVIAENGKPVIVRLSRCIDGRKGARLLAGQAGLRGELGDRSNAALTVEARAAVALVEARRRGIAAEPGTDR
jgi:type IV secretion system protein VirD4